MRRQILIIIALLVIFLFTTVQFTDAKGAKGIEFKPQVSIGDDIQAGKSITISGTSIAQYIVTVYNWALRVIVILAIAMIIFAGFNWIMSAGNASAVSKAKEQITSSLIGLLIAFGSYMLLNFINPALVDFRKIEIDAIKNIYLSDVSDGFIDEENNLENIEIKYKCLANGQTCDDTEPPSININEEICKSKLAEEPTCSGETPRKWCCGRDLSILNVYNSCDSVPNGQPCKLTATSVNGSGYCFNFKCERCKTKDTPCSARGFDFECEGPSKLCGKGGGGKCTDPWSFNPDNVVCE